MKYRDPETGKVFKNIESARINYCEGKRCRICRLPNPLTGKKEDSCVDFV